MSSDMPLGKNLKFLRNRSKLNQQQLADDLGITRAALASYETDKTLPPVTVLLKLADYFSFHTDTLLRIPLERLSELELRQLEAGNDVFVSGSRIRVLATTVDSQNRENITLVPLKAKAGYTAGYNDPEYIRQLPVFQLPFLQSERSYRAFQTEGDSMLPIPSGAWVIGEYIENWTSIKDGTPCIVVTADEGAVFKIIFNHLRQKKILLKSLNPEYTPYEIEAAEIREVWKFIYYFSQEMPSPMNESESIMARLTRIEHRLTSVNASDPALKS